MNDRFKFRAKLKNMDKWIVGAYLKMLPYQPYPVGDRKPLETEYKHLIITEGSADWGMPREISGYEVIPETVGQCTGLKDKNGKLIYEGDIVKENWHKYIISFNRGCYNITDVETQKCYTISACCCEKSEVIGNIYENKELLDEMNEIEKMYKNANVEDKNINNQLYKDLNYPQLTTKKQLELIKFMLHKGIYYDTDGDTYWFHYTDEIENAKYRPFKEAISEFINGLWQDLTEEEKEQVKGILNG